MQIIKEFELQILRLLRVAMWLLYKIKAWKKEENYPHGK